MTAIFVFGILILLVQFYTIYLIKQDEIDKKVEELVVKKPTEEEKIAETKAIRDFNEIMDFSYDRAKEYNK